jgi:hypothetical protein
MTMKEGAASPRECQGNNILIAAACFHAIEDKKNNWSIASVFA